MATFRANHGPPLSLACGGGSHTNCGHVFGGTVGGRDGRRRGIMRCFCACHSGCPLDDAPLWVSRTGWEQQCTCPGTEHAREKLDQADRLGPDREEFEQRLRERQERSRRERDERRTAFHEAFEAAGVTGVGKTPQQAREIFETELRARGHPLPADLVLDACADAIARDRQKMSLTYAARVMAELGKNFYDIISSGPWNE
jgi:hypothetical protein